MFGSVKQYFNKLLGGPPKANDTDTYRQEWEARKKANPAELAAKELEGIIGPLSEHTPVAVQRLSHSPNPSFSSSTNLHLTSANIGSSAITLPAASHSGPASGSTTTLAPLSSQQVGQRPGTVPVKTASDLQNSLNQAIGVIGRTKGLKHDAVSLGDRCNVLIQLLADLPPELKSSSKFSYEFTRMNQDLEDIVLFLNDFNKKNALRQAAARKEAHLHIAKLSKDFGNHLDLFVVIRQEHDSKLQGQGMEEMRETMNALHAIQNRARERTNLDNVDQVEDSEFKQHVKDVTGHDVESSFILKGRIRYRDNVPLSQDGLNFDVYKGQMVDEEAVAIKLYREKIVTDGKSLQFVRRMMRQVQIWTSFQHPSILPCYGIGMQVTKGSGDSSSVKFQFYLVSPFMRYGDAVQFINQRRRDKAYVDILRIIRQAAEGIQYLHGRAEPCVHAGMRGENVLIKDNGTACINGFGLTKVFSKTQTIQVTEPKVRWAWMAPELFNSSHSLTPSCDIWSWAMTALELISGQKPYYNIRPDYEVPNAIRGGQKPVESDYPAFREFSPQPDMMWALFEKCWSMKPEDRPTIGQVIEELDVIQEAQIKEQTTRHQWT
ncbi:hypothetical protein FRC12_001173 [Ceratobasidium sp. 428]|nr:hypothetical protein FRC12_001173 [Ceratobasidium sp. 428]